jgi:hypothetical protein
MRSMLLSMMCCVMGDDDERRDGEEPALKIRLFKYLFLRIIQGDITLGESSPFSRESTSALHPLKGLFLSIKRYFLYVESRDG